MSDSINKPDRPPGAADPHVLETDYAALTTEAGLLELADWTQIELTGADRASFLHNICTNEMRKLPPGAGSEAFFLNAKGHVLGHAFVFAGESSHLIFGSPGQNERLMAHLDRYIIREDVQLHDRTSEATALLLAGPLATQTLQSAVESPLPTTLLSGIEAKIGGHNIQIQAVDWAGPGSYLIQSAAANARHIAQALHAAGARPCGAAALEIVRIENGLPLYGLDISDRNLPQELGRDDRAISFVKGCYIGQETVARIDALGHVNRLLTGIRIDGPMPPPEATLTSDGQPAGELTSVTASGRLGAMLALGYLRASHAVAGTALTCGDRAAVVVSLPL